MLEHQITSKEKILKKVRAALNYKSKSSYPNIDLESSVFVRPDGETLSEAFVRMFTANSGKFVYCDNKFDCIDKLLDLIEERKWKYLFCWDDNERILLEDSGISVITNRENLDKIQVAVTGCEALIALTGCILVSSSRNSRVLSIWPPVHIVIAHRSQIVTDMKESLNLLRNRYGRNLPSLMSYINGPSKTASFPPVEGDLKMEWLTGAHGPVEQILFLIDDRKTD